MITAILKQNKRGQFGCQLDICKRALKSHYFVREMNTLDINQ